MQVPGFAQRVTAGKGFVFAGVQREDGVLVGRRRRPVRRFRVAESDPAEQDRRQRRRRPFHAVRIELQPQPRHVPEPRVGIDQRIMRRLDEHAHLDAHRLVELEADHLADIDAAVQQR